MINNDIKETNDYELLMLYQENNEDAKNILYTKYSFIVNVLVKKYRKFIDDLKIDIEEVYSEAYIGFSDALKSYQDNKKASLPTFITLCVERRINAIIRKYSREKYKILQDTFSLDFIYDEDLSLLDTIKDEEHEPLKNITDQERYEDLINSINNNLTKNEQDVFILMVKGFNYQEIARILNKTPKQIDNTMQRIKIKVRKIVKE